jgi:PKD repeat protein
MSLAAGMGSVTVKNAVLYSGACAEKLAATKHCNGQDVWVLSHDNNNTNFRAFLVTSAGVSTLAVISPVGSTHISYHGQMKISPNGRKVGVALQYVSNIFEVFDFNSATGVLSNCIGLTPSVISFNSSYGCEFSPDGSKFYGTMDGKIFQWDLCAGSNSNIIQTEYAFAIAGPFSLQLAINGKIYATRQADSSLGVINNPDLAGPACNYVHSGQFVSPKVSYWGLPNFMSSYFKKAKEFDLYIDSADCQKIHFFKPCTPLPGPTSIAWNFGDPASGANQSTASNVTHKFSSGGIYTVRLIMYYSCSSDTVIKQIIIPNVPAINVSGNQAICTGQTATLLASGAISYSWSNSAIGPMITTSPLSTSVYTVTGSTSINNCRSKATFTLDVNPSPTVAISGNQTVCETDTLLLQATGAFSYTWSSGGTGAAQIILSPKTGSVISVTGFDSNGCYSTISTSLNTFPSPTITVSGINEICSGESTTLVASGGNSYQWLQYGVGPSLTDSPLSTNIYTVIGISTLGNCYSTEHYLVNVNLCTNLRNQTVTGENILSIYPNPAIHLININTIINADIKIHDVYGRVAYVGFIETGDNWIDVSSFSAGIFFVSSPTLSTEIKFLKIAE